MLFSSHAEFVSVFLAIVAFQVVLRLSQNPWLRNLSLLAINVLLLLSFLEVNTVFNLSILATVFYGGSLLLLKRKRKALLVGLIALVTGLFVIKNYPWVHDLLEDSLFFFLNDTVSVVERVGLSYLLFRMIHYAVDVHQGRINNKNFLTYWNYLFYFPNFLAGPIDRFQNFKYWLESPRKGYINRLFFSGVGRVFIGAVKTVLVVPLFSEYAVDHQALQEIMAPPQAILLSLLLYSAYIFIEFSGYSDIAIGTGYMMGIRTEENFQSPYLSQNISEFWRKWHISFSSFLKDYLFMPLIRWMNRFSIRQWPLLVSCLGYVLVFGICGLWHGSTLSFFIWGLWHGVGLSLYKLYTALMVPRMSTKLLESVWYKGLAGIVTFGFVTLGWAWFNYSVEEVIEMGGLLWA